MKNRILLPTLIVLVFLLLPVRGAFTQEKKNIRMVFVSLAWNSEIPFRAALARGYFKQQGLNIEPIDSKFTLDQVVNDRVLKIAQQELRAEGRLK